jgi:hypothetical protein
MAGAVPSASDNAEICANKTAKITGIAAAARKLKINLGGLVQIFPTSSLDASLTLGNGTGALTSTLDGPLELRDDAAHTVATKATLAFTSVDHTVNGGSFIRGFADDSVIDIQTSGKTLTLGSLASIRSQLVISGAGNFTNQGFVSANAQDGTLTVAVGGTVSDTVAGNRWRVSATNATLLFDAPSATGLVGNFIIDGNGTLQVDDTVTSTGRLQQSTGAVQVNEDFTLGNASNHANLTGGTITVANTKQFVHN